MSTKIQSQDLEGGVVTPGNNKYYGTEGTGTEGFQDLQTVLTALGYIAGGSGATVPNKTATYTAGENISIGDHLSYGPYTTQYQTVPDTIKTYTVSGNGNPPPTVQTVDYGEAFTWEATSILGTIIPNIRISTASESGGLNQQISYSLTIKIYAITGSYGTTAVNTGAALRTSATVSGTVSFTTVVLNPTFTFSDLTPLPAGQYAMKIEGNISSSNGVANSNGVLRIYGDNAGGYSGNGIDVSTPVVPDMGFVAKSSLTVAVKGDASDSEKLQYIGISTTNTSLGGTVTAQIRGSIAQAGATVDEELWYLSNTPGTISTTAGTNRVFVGKGNGSNTVSIRGLTHLDSTVYSAITSGQIFFAAGGGILDFDATITNPDASSNSFSMQISEDRSTRYTLGTQKNNSAYSVDHVGSYIIPSNKFIRLVFSTSGSGSVTINKLRFIPS